MEEEPTEPFKDGSDLCQHFMDQYGNSTTPQHCHLLATIATLPFTPLAYFAVPISTLNVAKALDHVALSALVSFMSITLPLVQPSDIASTKSREVVEILVAVLARKGLGMSSMRALVKCLGVLIGFFYLEDWDGIKVGFETLLKFSIDKPPKTCRCAQEFVENVYKFLKSPTVTKEARKLVLLELKSCNALVTKLDALRTLDGCAKDKVSQFWNLQSTLLKPLKLFLKRQEFEI